MVSIPLSIERLFLVTSSVALDTTTNFLNVSLLNIVVVKLRHRHRFEEVVVPLVDVPQALLLLLHFVGFPEEFLEGPQSLFRFLPLLPVIWNGRSHHNQRI